MTDETELVLGFATICTIIVVRFLARKSKLSLALLDAIVFLAAGVIVWMGTIGRADDLLIFLAYGFLGPFAIVDPLTRMEFRKHRPVLFATTLALSLIVAWLLWINVASFFGVLRH